MKMQREFHGINLIEDNKETVLLKEKKNFLKGNLIFNQQAWSGFVMISFKLLRIILIDCVSVSKRIRELLSTNISNIL